MVSDGVMHSRLEQDLSRGEEPIEVLGELRYCGIIDHQTFVNFVQMSLTDNENLQQLLDCYQVYSRSFHITVELMQNVNRHGARLGTEKIINEQRSSIDSLNMNPYPCWISYALLVTEEEVIIRCSNFVVEGMRAKLEKKLGNSDRLTPEESRIIYMTQLSTGTLSERGGAGLGLIDVARKSSEFRWWFTPYNDEKTLFTVESRLNRADLKRKQEEFRARIATKR